VNAALDPFVVDVGALAAVVIAVGGAGTLIARWVKGLFHHAVAEVDERIELKTQPILDQLKPNGGYSLRDAVDRMEHRVARIEKIVQIDAAASVSERADDAERRK
jgi:hypothetical protein